MKKLVLIIVFCALCGTSNGAEIIGDYPICKTQDDAQSFGQAKMFTDEQKMTSLIENGNCFFAAPETRATILQRGMSFEVLVFKPYSAPIKGWTNPGNIHQ